MSCHNCCAEYGILKKEVGCETCGFSFCSRCCKKQEIPSENGSLKKQLTCTQCFNKMDSSEKMDNGSQSPPLAHKKRMALLKKQSMSVDSSMHLTNKKDQELVDRLQRLKRERIKAELPSDTEIAERLAKLKGINPEVYTAPPIQVFVTDKRTSLEKAADLMKQFTDEVNLDSKLVKPEDEIAARLALLKDEKLPEKPAGVDVSSYAVEPVDMDAESCVAALKEGSKESFKTLSKEVEELASSLEYKKLSAEKKEKVPEESDEENDEAEAEKLVEKLLASNAATDMEDLDSLSSPDKEITGNEEPIEEFPWCIICSEDAKIRCFGCDGDLYCQSCFKECHDNAELNIHKTCPYLPPTSPVL